tara:strand:- start:2375 stop:3277 length:903 start_codon:yes stop_codon:yes gene_type:complete
MKTTHAMILLTTFLGIDTTYSFQTSSLHSRCLKSPNVLKSTNDLYTSTYTPPNTKQNKNFSDSVPLTSKVLKSQINKPVLVQGGSLRTWSYRSPLVEQVQIVLSSEGRPLDADVELWNGPDNTPCKMRVYVENGQARPFSAVIETPRAPNTIAVRNIGQLEFPFAADVYTNDLEQPSQDCIDSSTTIQGGALRTYPFDPFVDSVEVLLTTDGRPLNARIELLQGPNNNKQVIELYTEDGLDRPFFCILETPESGNVVRIVNTAPIEFPMSAGVVPHSLKKDFYSGPVVGGYTPFSDNLSW